MKIRSILLIMGSVVFLHFGNLSANEKYVADPGKTSLRWYGSKVTGEHYGHVDLKSGYVVMKDNQLLEGKFFIDMKSISNKDIENEGMRERLVNHLKSDDFFSVDTHPESMIIVKNKPDFSDGKARVIGDLTIKGITHPVEFDATMEKNGDDRKFNAKIIVDRSKYDIRFRSKSFFNDLGDNMIYDDFEITLDMVVGQ